MPGDARCCLSSARIAARRAARAGAGRLLLTHLMPGTDPTAALATATATAEFTGSVDVAGAGRTLDLA
ncbi:MULTISPECIES: hypothetical protein [Catenuloplanes]|uniref:Ribonuclease BN (tRNA processing enzyme) n=1 Tax=Catenuloplanes niger TaxID=587534 RepID=A0AAE4A267_9ACTN|nr:hypothetical protein [Catenuloplanes niger]MDR7327855.1 ribonuclease BN (tRNA processing enzyme) [Catenuloplanes niger]